MDSHHITIITTPHTRRIEKYKKRSLLSTLTYSTSNRNIPDTYLYVNNMLRNYCNIVAESMIPKMILWEEYKGDSGEGGKGYYYIYIYFIDNIYINRGCIPFYSHHLTLTTITLSLFYPCMVRVCVI